MMINIRRATIKDKNEVIGLLLELKRSAYQEMGMPQTSLSAPETAADLFQKMLTNDEVHIYVCEDNQKIVGVCVAYETPKIAEGKNRMMIEELVILPDYRGKGMGTNLLFHIESVALDKGITTIKVTTGTKLKANDFYRKHGYVFFENAYRKKL